MATVCFLYIVLIVLFYGFSGGKSEELPTSLHREAKNRNGLFFSIQDYAITLVFKTLRVLDAFSCVSACLKEPRCQSVNFDTSGHPKHHCELSQKSQQCHASSKEPRPGFIHYFSSNKDGSCKQSQCKNGATCEPSCNQQGYLCKCGPFNQGQYCQLWTVPISSCQDILSKTSYRTDMAYTYMIDNRQTDIYCHLSSDLCGSRGWTMVIKTDGSKNTFAYASPLWSYKDVYDLSAGRTGFDHHETKMPSYWAMPFTKLCFGMKVGNNLNWAGVSFNATSLYDIIACGVKREIDLGGSKWLGLIEGASMQANCKTEGFNVGVPSAYQTHGRIGAVANDQNDCLSPDSVFGFGLWENVSCGNICLHSCNNGRQQTPAFGYILIQ